MRIDDLRIGKADNETRQINLFETVSRIERRLTYIEQEQKHVIKVMQVLDLTQPNALRALYSYQGILRYLSAQERSLQADSEGCL